MAPRTTIECDASTARVTLESAHLAHWGGVDPTGRALTANNYYLSVDGSPLALVAGEFHPQRYPADEWEDAILAIKSAGCTMVSSYVFWSLVEPSRGNFNFSENNDIRRFAELCQRHDMLFSPRIGPYNNSEFLVGGLPPWLYGLPVTERSNDQGYLDLVGHYYAAVGQQLRGLYWQDGGPIVVVQLENELGHAPNDWQMVFGHSAAEYRGPENGAEFADHLENLRSLAIKGGITAPIFSMTGWGTDGHPPENQFMVTYGAYMQLHPPKGSNSLHTTFLPNPFRTEPYPYRGRYPVAFCELGTGSPSRDSYRPMPAPETMLVTAFTRFGSVESIMLGYYMFHGGTNPVRGDGFSWTTKAAMFPQRSYDFWAPVSEFGERRTAFYTLAPLNRFVTEFGHELAEMQSLLPESPVTDPNEDRLRAAVKADTASAFVLLSNYGNVTNLSARPDVQISVALSTGEIRFPRHTTLAVDAGATAILPVGLRLGGGVLLVSATAQPFARVGSEREPWIVFHAPEGNEVEYVIAGGAAITGAMRQEHDEDGAVTVIPQGTFAVDSIRVATMTTSDAEHSQVAELAGQRRVVTSADELTIIGDTVTVSRIVDLAQPLPELSCLVLPPLEQLALSARPAAPAFGQQSIVIERLNDARWVLRAPEVPPEDLSHLWADIHYDGDLCRLFDAGTGHLVGDDFQRGIPWRVKLGRFRDALAGAGLQLRVEPRSESVQIASDDGMVLDNVTDIAKPASVLEVRLLARVSVDIHLEDDPQSQ